MRIHTPVLLKEVICFLEPRPGDTVVDATVNGGGHAMAILKIIGRNGVLIGIDQDQEVIRRLKEEIKDKKAERVGNIILINGNFRNLDKLLEPFKIKIINGVLFDLGLSSYQIEYSARGFSYLRSNEPLLMNFKNPLDPDDLTAREILNKWPEKEIFRILKEYGEEKYSRRISREIVKARRRKPLESTGDFLDLIKKSLPRRWYPGKHPAKRSFQALRIAVNDELGALKEGLENSWRLLSSKGRMVVISFHSLEDRIVKGFFKEKEKNGEGQIQTPKPVVPTRRELEKNPRSRGAKLRSIVKI
jgi:16S rRNA (cytosine1402-N4)-methyltransferase